MADDEERQQHPERFAPPGAPPGFAGYTSEHIAKVLHDARAHYPKGWVPPGFAGYTSDPKTARLPDAT